MIESQSRVALIRLLSFPLLLLCLCAYTACLKWARGRSVCARMPAQIVAVACIKITPTNRFPHKAPRVCTERKGRMVYDRMCRRHFGRRRNRGCLFEVNDPSPITSFRSKRLRSFRSERSIRKQKYIARKCRRRTRSLRSLPRSKVPLSSPPIIPFITSGISFLPWRFNFDKINRANCFLSSILLLLLSCPVAYGRLIRDDSVVSSSPPTTPYYSMSETIGVIWRFVLIFAVISIVTLRRGSRNRVPNILSPDFIDISKRKWNYGFGPISKDGQKYAAKKAADANKIQINEERRKQRELLKADNVVYDAAEKKKLDDRLRKEVGMSPSTRDVKHFAESMCDECDMEACRVRIKFKYTFFY